MVSGMNNDWIDTTESGQMTFLNNCKDLSAR